MAIVDHVEMQRQLLADLQDYFKSTEVDFPPCVGCKVKPNAQRGVSLQMQSSHPLSESTSDAQAVVLLTCGLQFRCNMEGQQVHSREADAAHQ